MSLTWPVMSTNRPTKLDPPVIYGELCEDAPVTRVRFPAGMEGWLVTRFDDVAAAFRHRAFAAARPRYESPDPDATGKTPTPFSGAFVHLDGGTARRTGASSAAISLSPACAGA